MYERLEHRVNQTMTFAEYVSYLKVRCLMGIKPPCAAVLPDKQNFRLKIPASIEFLRHLLLNDTDTLAVAELDWQECTNIDKPKTNFS